MDNKLILAMTLSTATFFVFQYFNQKKPGISQSSAEIVAAGQSYRVPTAEELQRPLNKEIDFIDTKVTQKEVRTSIDTELCHFEFSNYGGVLSSLVFKKRIGKDQVPLHSMVPKDFFHREEGSFLLALGEKTPYFYETHEPRKVDGGHEISFHVTIKDWVLRKTYRIYDHTYRVDLTLSFEPKGSSPTPLQPRIFLPAPFVAELETDKINGISYDPTAEKIRITTNEQELGDAWKMPEIFGAEDRYFLHTLIGDESHFTQRGYYRKMGNGKLYTILEGPEIIGKHSTELTFYLGPKDIEDLQIVEPRLEGVLNFGWTSWLCKVLLKLLAFLYSYLGNWGWAIIALTILIKIPMLPLTLKSAEVMEKYQKVQPQIARIRQKWRHDMQKMQTEILTFHKEHNLSPAGQLIGCLPMLIDIPIMIALWTVLGNYMDLYQAPFVGWIVDLSSKDPYYILPLFMGASMIWQQRLAPVGDEKQRVVMLFVSLLATAVFANFAAGLVLYWLTKNIITVGETYLRKVLMVRRG